jgi:hypothetical protein
MESKRRGGGDEVSLFIVEMPGHTDPHESSVSTGAVGLRVFSECLK